MSSTEHSIIAILEMLLTRQRNQLVAAQNEKDIRMFLDMLHEFRQPQQIGGVAGMDAQTINANIEEMKRIAKTENDNAQA